MRLVGLAVSLALAACLAGSAAIAATPVATQALAPEEVLVEVGAIGTATTRADLATINVRVRAAAATDEGAAAALRARLQRIVVAARQAGVPVAGIGQTEPDAMPDDVAFDIDANMATDAQTAAGETPPRTAPAPPQRHVTAMVTVNVTDIARVPAVRAALVRAYGDEGTEYGNVSEPVFTLVNADAARRAARAQALASVRADAEAYAAALNLRVARMVRVSERTGIDLIPQLVTGPGALRRVFGPEVNHGPDIVTVLVLGADFVLAPR